MAFLRSLLFIGAIVSMVLAAQETKAASCVSNSRLAVLPIYCPEAADSVPLLEKHCHDL